MAIYLLDTNVLLRLSDGTSPEQFLTRRAVINLRLGGNLGYITAQNLIEFWAVATRPVAVNGLGWTTVKTRQEVEQLLDQFPLLEDTPAVLAHWLYLVATHDIKGKRTHDARLVAMMLAHGVTRLLTFNTEDFQTFADVSLVHPREAA